MPIDFAIPGDRNVIKTEAERIIKHKDLIKEIRRMWNVKTKVVTVIAVATGTISKSLRQYLNNSRKYEIKELRKTATLGPANLLRKVLM